MSTTFVLVRHCETEWNRIGRIQGRSFDIPLNENGKKQAEALGKALSAQSFDHVVSSTLSRAKETADIIRRHLPTNIPLTECKEEISWGHLEGKYKSGADEVAYKAIISQRRAGDEDCAPPGGESVREAKLRALTALSGFLTQGCKRVLVISHGALLAELLAHFTGSENSGSRWLSIPNGSRAVVEYHHTSQRFEVVEQRL